MKILSLISSFLQGGAQNVLVDLVTGLSEHEHCVVHFTGRKCVNPHLPYIDRLDRAGVPCIDAPWNSINTETGRRAVLRSFQPDVVLCHWWGHDPWLPWIHEVSTAPPGSRPEFVCVMHHYGIPAASGYDRYVLVSEAQRPQCAALPAPDVRAIPNGVDLSRFEGFTRTRRPHGQLIVGRLSVLRPGKIPDDWISTANAYQLPDTRFVIAGWGELLPRLAEDIKKTGRPEQFELPGYVPREKVPAFLETLDVFCHVTSDAVECHPLALIEALASGLPIVSVARGGIPDIVLDGQNGLLAESNLDIGRLLHRLRREPQLVEHLSRGALETAERFSSERQMFSYRELLAEIEGVQVATAHA